MRLLPVLVIAFFLSPCAFADDAPVDCRRGGDGQQSMNICAGYAASRAESLLEELEVFLGRDDDEEARILRSEARRSFTAFADTQCESSADRYRGGSMQAMVRNDCWRDLALWRAHWLLDSECDISVAGCEEQRKLWLERLQKLEHEDAAVDPSEDDPQ